MLTFFNFFALEHRHERPISTRAFARRLARNGGAVAIIVGLALIVGMVGYHWLGDQAWIDAFLNACMILGGMGQVGDVKATSGKLFAGIYALLAEMVILIVAATMLTPIFHRVLHRFHWEGDHSGS
jgi:sterol desaturase/sphingolipid hydroxylase (fatty acid hydroxylase superfamily)